jgi:hypothetical protein
MLSAPQVGAGWSKILVLSWQHPIGANRDVSVEYSRTEKGAAPEAGTFDQPLRYSCISGFADLIGEPELHTASASFTWCGAKGRTDALLRVIVTKLDGGTAFQALPSRSNGSDTMQRPLAVSAM